MITEECLAPFGFAVSVERNTELMHSITAQTADTPCEQPKVRLNENIQLEVKLLSDINHDCGHCMHHLPDLQIDRKWPMAIVSGKGRGGPAYWLCKCSKTKHYMKGRVAEDGTRCNYFDDRYSDPRKIDKWVGDCHAMSEQEKEYYEKRKAKQKVVSNKSTETAERKYLKRGLPVK